MGSYIRMVSSRCGIGRKIWLRMRKDESENDKQERYDALNMEQDLHANHLNSHTDSPFLYMLGA